MSAPRIHEVTALLTEVAVSKDRDSARITLEVPLEVYRAAKFELFEHVLVKHLGTPLVIDESIDIGGDL